MYASISMFQSLLLAARKYILGVRSHRARKQDRIAINAKNLIFDKEGKFVCMFNKWFTTFRQQ